MKTRQKQREVEPGTPINVQETSELKYFQKSVLLSLEIKKLRFQIGTLKSYIDELEDAEKAKHRYEIRKEKEFDTLRKEITKLLATKAELSNKINKLEKEVNKEVNRRSEFTKFIKPINKQEDEHERN
jgi:chromosome segregation ATPase